MKIQLRAGIALVALLACAPTFAQSSAAPDNTQSNTPPVNSAMKSSIADGQSNMASDLKITQQIRKSVMADKSLSTYAGKKRTRKEQCGEEGAVGCRQRQGHERSHRRTSILICFESISYELRKLESPRGNGLVLARLLAVRPASNNECVPPWI